MGSKSYILTVKNWPSSETKAFRPVSNVCSQEVTDCFTSKSVTIRLPIVSLCFYRFKEMNRTGHEVGSGP